MIMCLKGSHIIILFPNIAKLFVLKISCSLKEWFFDIEWLQFSERFTRATYSFKLWMKNNKQVKNTIMHSFRQYLSRYLDISLPYPAMYLLCCVVCWELGWLGLGIVTAEVTETEPT